MANLTTKSFSDLVSQFAITVQGNATQLLDFTVGSVLRALAEAVAGVTVWLESLILLLLQTTRLATSSGSDVDSFVGDFGLTRLPAVAAKGTVTFARFTSTFQAQIAVGTTLSTADLSQSFTVVADTTQPAYNASLNAYIIPAGTPNIAATVQAVTAGTGGNVAANTITVITQAIPYVDTVTNALAFGNGQNAETDQALKARFVSWFASLSRATRAAILNAILSVQVGVSATLTENFQYNGTPNPGYFYAVVDDGSGNPPGSFLTACANAIELTRGFTITYSVFAPVTLTANVVMFVTVAAGYTPATVKAQVQAAVLAYIQALTLGQALPYSYLATIAYGVAGVTNVTGVTLNGGTADLVPTNQQRVIAGTVTVN